MKNSQVYYGVPPGSPTARMAQAAGIVLLLNLLSRVLGFVRDASIAARFGAGTATDAYLVAYTIPYFLQTILGMAFLTVMVPVLTAYLVKGEREQGWEVTSAVGNWTVIIMVVLAVLGIVLAPSLVVIIAPGFSGEAYQLTVKLTRIMFLSLPFMATGMLVSGILNSGYIFTSPALAPTASNLVIIATVIFFGGVFGITGLAVGTVISFAVYLVIQVFDLKRLRFKYNAGLLYQHPVVRKIGQHLLPVSFSLAVVQLYLAINRFFASQLEPGSITALDFGNRLVMLPLGIFVASITTAVFPSLAEQAARGNRGEMASLINRGLGLVTAAILPAVVGLVALRGPLVQLAFQRGAFDHQAAAMTATAVLFFSVGLLPQAMHPIFTRSFYALQDVKIPVVAGFVSVALNILFSVILAPLLGHGGLALANSLAITAYAGMLYLSLIRTMPELERAYLPNTIAKAGLAAAVMGLVVWLAGRGLNIFDWNGSFLALLTFTGAVIVLAVFIYLIMANLLRLQEIDIIKGLIRGKLKGGQS